MEWKRITEGKGAGMETTYREWEKRRQERSGGVRRAGSSRRKERRVTLGVRERRRLIQLGLCVALFLAVFAGKGLFPEKMLAFQEKALEVLRSDTDFEAVFAGLGKSISEGAPVVDTLEDLWVEVFGGADLELSDWGPEQSALFRSQVEALAGAAVPGAEPSTLAGRFGIPLPADEPEAPAEESKPAEPETAEEPAEPAVVVMPYDGPALPDNATMDRYNLEVLGVGETVTPALGWLSSPFGWREHPVDGGEKFHNGVDLAVNTGTAVGAFADGVVDYIGDSPVYGLYLQVRHAGGLTSFYAHCSELCVQQGQSVAAGETVALSGDTGNSTGPHLHFEMKLNGTLLNPLYYIETE